MNYDERNLPPYAKPQRELLKLELRLAKPLVRFTGIEQARAAQDQLGRITTRLLKDKVSFEPISFPDFTPASRFPTTAKAPATARFCICTAAYTAGGLDYARGLAHCSLLKPS
jgi:hypothetical protein